MLPQRGRLNDTARDLHNNVDHVVNVNYHHFSSKTSLSDRQPLSTMTSAIPIRVTAIAQDVSNLYGLINAVFSSFTLAVQELLTAETSKDIQ